MLSFFFRQLFSSIGVFFRTIRAFFTRQLTGAAAKLRRLTNFSRHATKVASASFQGAAAAMKPPTRREDYIETQQLFISKSFLVTLLLGLIALGVLIYLVVWPFLLSRFFTAHFWESDERVAEWSGKVVVYYDETKEIPRYSGRLEEGLLQGKGKLYDHDGLLIYEGGFVDGVKSGKGSSYEAGVLVYEGGFQDDAYSGAGILYENGMKVYEGAFSNSLPDGKGTCFTEGGIRYSGGFADGLYSGEGTLYYASGEKQYVGEFAEGTMSGQGTFYLENGFQQYKGEFAENLFNGAGTLYLEDNRGYIEANFADGVTDGDIAWYIDGKLWYAGGADNLIPDGYGEIYTRSGKVVYAGEMDRGTIDGHWLLSLTTGELREAFGQASTAEMMAIDGGFFIMNRDLDLIARCSYQSEESESKPFSVWISRQDSEAARKNQSIFVFWSDILRDDTNMAELMPWQSGSEFYRWAAAMTDGNAQSASEFDEHGMQKIRCHYDGWYCTAGVYDGLPVIVSWTVEGAVDTFDSSQLISQEVSQSQQQLETLLDILDGVALPEMDSQAGPDVGDFLTGIRSAEDGRVLVSALLDLYENEQTLALLESSRPLLEELLTATALSAAQGSSNQEAVDSLQRELDVLDLRISQCIANREKALLTISSQTDLDTTEYDLSKLLVSYDPVELDIQSLCQAAADYAAALADEGSAVDTVALNVEVKTAVINLAVAYQSLRFQRQEQEAAAAAAEKIAADYAKGSADREDLLRAQGAQNDAAAALYTTMCSFTRETDLLNHLTGGALSRELGWLSDAYTAVFDADVEDTQAQLQQQKEREEALQELLNNAASAPEVPAEGEPAPEDTSQNSASQGADTPTETTENKE